MKISTKRINKNNIKHKPLRSLRLSERKKLSLAETQGTQRIKSKEKPLKTGCYKKLTRRARRTRSENLRALRVLRGKGTNLIA